MKSLLTFTAAVALLGSAALAGPVADYETPFREAYGTYRAALFGTNAGKADVSAGAINTLQAQLNTLLAEYREVPPPQYEDDPMWTASMDSAAATIDKAKAEIVEGRLPEAHETLEAFRDIIGDLHTRNGVLTYSDRMNAYHAEMEHLLAIDVTALDSTGIGEIREKAAVLSYLADDLLAHPPSEAEGSEEYTGLSRAFSTSVDALLSAVRSADVAAVKTAIGGLKVPYSKLFLKFG
ncbi:hypothetical protein ACN2XU_21920 [Primorskyibacter sp. 2E107]|uniref:hypothetical protein n=1 Tax=Primorskyibacter sp. 2E107 TaxID=3403458 RepID=UPI003AF57065